MGLSSSQARFFQCNDAINKATYNLLSLTMDKTALANDMDKVAREHNFAMNQKMLKWSTNSGITYQDLSYQNLMQPGVINGQMGGKTYLITDLNGKIVVDSKYSKYAKMISPNGNTGGDYQSNRTAILEDLTGISASKIEGAGSLDSEAQKNKKILDDIITQKPKAQNFRNDNLCCLLEKLGDNTGIDAKIKGADDWADAYQHGGTINLGSGQAAKNSLNSIVDHLSNTLSKYLLPESALNDPDATSDFIKACEDFKPLAQKVIDDGNENPYLTKDGDNYVLNITNFVDSLMFNYDGASFDENDNAVCPWYDVDSTDFINYKNSYSAWETEYNTAKTNYENSLSDSASVLTADEELKIEFYDNLFNAIVDKGWSFNENINDPNYLNNMLQNNMFTITTVDRRDVSMDFSEDYYEKSIYSTDIATNMTNIVQVRDQEAMLEENSRYEEKKRIINKKETAIDLKIKEEEMKIQSWNVIKESLAKTIESNKDRLNVFG